MLINHRRSTKILSLSRKVFTEVFPGIQMGNCGLGFEAAFSLGTSVPFHYMTYIIRTCPIVEGNFRTQVSFNSRPELIIESYELYISTSETASARNSNEESPVFDPLQLVIGMVRKHHDGEQGYVGYRLQKYSWKEPVNGTPDDCSKNFRHSHTF